MWSAGTGASSISYARIGLGILDEGVKDSQQVTVTWGDGEKSFGSVWEGMDCDPRGGAIFVTRVFEPDDVLFPVTIDVEDDDTGADTRRIDLLDLNVNDDDDNANEKFDVRDTVFSDDDLKLVNLDALKRPGMDPATGDFELLYSPGAIRLWTSPAKTTLIYPHNAPVSPEELGLTGITTVPYTGQATAYVEGLAGSASYIIVNWAHNNPPDYKECIDDFIVQGNSIYVRVWGIDIDTDSDNMNGIERSEPEDLIEDEAGHGKSS
jgi:hypothetical protein